MSPMYGRTTTNNSDRRLQYRSSKDISSRLKSLEERFENDVKGLKELSVSNKTRTELLHSANTVEFILKGIVNEPSLKTQTEHINYLISKLILCQKTVVLLVNILVNKHNRFEFLWKKHEEKDNSNTKDDRIQNTDSRIDIFEEL